MPPSSPDNDYSLPTVLAERIADETGVPRVAAARTVSAREQMKNVSLDDKLRVLDGTIEIDASSVQGKTVLLLDDLYQSGVSMNYVGMLLLDAGATAVLGLTVEKTCRNDDNLGGGQP
jgi:predicted amidophosphoribosyltransferase